MKSLAKLLALLPLAVVAFAGYAYGTLYFAGYLFPRVVPRPYFEMMSSAAVGSIVAGLLVSLPLIKLFPKGYWVAGIAVASPFMLLRANDFAYYLQGNEPRILVMSAAEFLLYPALIVAVCLAADRLFPRLRHGA